MRRRHRSPARWAALAMILPALPLLATGCAPKVRVTGRGIEVHPERQARGGGSPHTPADAALLTRLILSATPRMDVRWRLPDLDDPDFWDVELVEPAGGEGEPARATGRIGEALASARATIQAIPKKRWRKRALKKIGPLGLESLGEEQGAALLDALGLRDVGDPEGAIRRLASASGEAMHPLLSYQLGVAYLESGRLAESAEPFRRLLAASKALPGPFLKIAEAAVDAADGEPRKSLGPLTSVQESAPALPEAFYFRAWLSREACDLYRPDRILSDVDSAIHLQPCCPGCPLILAEMESFTGQPWSAVHELTRSVPCVPGVLDSLRDRAQALAMAAAGQHPRAMEAAAAAEGRDTSALRSGLAGAFILGGDFDHLREAYDAEAELTRDARFMLEQQFNAGLNELWSGRPSAAASHFERAEEHARTLQPEGWSPRGTLQLATALKIRSYLVAGRVDEAHAAAGEARTWGKSRLNGLLIYTTAQVDLARGDDSTAISETRRLITSEEKFWLYLATLDASIMRQRQRRSQTSLFNALSGVNTQINFCPGVPVEPYVMRSQAELLLAQGRYEDASRAATAVVNLGPRGYFAPDVLVPALEILAQAREALGDLAGARKAYTELVDRWDTEERIPVVERAREKLTGLQEEIPR